MLLRFLQALGSHDIVGLDGTGRLSDSWRALLWRGNRRRSQGTGAASTVPRRDLHQLLVELYLSGKCFNLYKLVFADREGGNKTFSQDLVGKFGEEVEKIRS